jgi:hypothetical protein
VVVPHDCEGPVPLAAVYLLVPGRPDAAAPARRTRLSDAAAARALLARTNLGTLGGPSMRESLLERMAELVDRVPVYQLEVAFGFDYNAELTSHLWSWHEAPLMHAFAGGVR